MRRLRAVAVTWFLAAPLLAGCHQQRGERCQLDSDCADGLTCLVPVNGSRAEGGKCDVPGFTTDAGLDASGPTLDGAKAADSGGAADSTAPLDGSGADSTTPGDAAGDGGNG